LASHKEIYRIVSSKALDNGDAGQGPITGGTNINLDPSVASGSKDGGKCC
jgi:Ras-related protein Rab-11A